ncbi:MAG TPA: lytic murein transglycosylase [Nocardioides sp.]|nr:lytic murein transglycosylase [Nocardioides sp.]
MTHHRGLAAAVGIVTAGLAVAIGLVVAVAYAGQGGPLPEPPATGAAGAPTVAATVDGAQQRADDPVPARYRPDPTWLEATAARTQIPVRALAAYAQAHLTVAAEQPDCEVAWNTLAALGGIESQHGSIHGSVLGPDGLSRPAIRGPALDGGAFGAVRDTDGGSLDGDTRWDRAVGPLQFIPSTWETWAADANGDGVADPDQIDDAALAAGRYLCHSGALSDAAAWRRAVFSFNHSDTYVDDVARLADTYAQLAD